MMQPVQSSNVAEVGWIAATQKLAIKFVSGDCYIFDGVPDSVYAKLMTASSIGSYFNSQIKKKYLTTKVSESDLKALFASTTSRQKRPRISQKRAHSLRSIPGSCIFF